MCIDFLASCRRQKPNTYFLLLNSHAPFIFVLRSLVYFHIAAVKYGVSRSQSPATCPFVCCVTFCVSVSLLGPCCWRARQAVPIKRAQGGLLWQQLLWCAVLSVFVCVCVCCLLAVQGRQAQFTWSRLLLCPLLSLWESFLSERGRYSIMPQVAKQTVSFSFLSLYLLSFLLPFHSLITLHLPNLLFSLYFSLNYSSRPLSSWPSPSLSVCLHSSSIWTYLVSIHKQSSVKLCH